MKYDHRVKVNGVWYNAGVEVSTPATNTVEHKENANPNSIYKRSDIQKMKTDELRVLAKKLDIDYEEEANATQLKKDILVKLGI